VAESVPATPDFVSVGRPGSMMAATSVSMDEEGTRKVAPVAPVSAHVTCTDMGHKAWEGLEQRNQSVIPTDRWGEPPLVKWELDGPGRARTRADKGHAMTMKPGVSPFIEPPLNSQKTWPPRGQKLWDITFQRSTSLSNIELGQFLAIPLPGMGQTLWDSDWKDT
jgi:hypothetical protein